jgi:hypothetical protein
MLTLIAVVFLGLTCFGLIAYMLYVTPGPKDRLGE